MPDLANRYELEAAFSQELARMQTQQAARLLARLQRNLSFDDIPQEEWDRIREETAMVVGTYYRRVYRQSSVWFAFGLGFGTEWERSARRSMNDWADAQADLIARQITETSVERVKRLVEEALRERDRKPLLWVPFLSAGLLAIFSVRRAATISVTETTKAASAGELAVAQIYNRYVAKGRAVVSGPQPSLDLPIDAPEPVVEPVEPLVDRFGRPITPSGQPVGQPPEPPRQTVRIAKPIYAYWVTARDEKVCPICRPLNDKPEYLWTKDFPNGPPAHPVCRCYLNWREAE